MISKRHIAFVLFILTLGGCARGLIENVVVELAPISKSQPISVQDFDTSATIFQGDDSGDANRVAIERQTIPQTISQELCIRLGSKGMHATKYAEADTKGDVLVVSGVIVEVNHGSASARFWWGMGAGKATIKAHVKIYKAHAPNDILGEFDLVGTSGGTGGAYGYQDWVRANAVDMAEHLARYLDKKSS